jgi:hypothetical protein
MLDFKLLKKALIAILSIPALVLFSIYLIQISKDTSIKDFVIVDKLDLKPSNVSDSEYIQNDISNIKFEYKLIGYRSGGLESSVIVQKSNQEYVVSIGEKLEGIFELIEVSQDEIIFREGSKIYKIKNTVGK